MNREKHIDFICTRESPQENEDPKSRKVQVLIYEVEERVVIVKKKQRCNGEIKGR